MLGILAYSMVCELLIGMWRGRMEVREGTREREDMDDEKILAKGGRDESVSVSR